MTTCLDEAASYMEKKVQAVQTKKAIVVALFFTYCVYTVSLVGKHVLKHLLAGKSTEKMTREEKESHDNKLKYSRALSELQHDIIGKSFFMFYLVVVVQQVFSSVWAALLTYAYLAALGCQVVGCLGAFGPGEESKMGALKGLRLIGLVVVLVLCGLLYWSLLIDDWCDMFYFHALFSLKYTS